jgi:hypothetical protein
LSQAAEEAGIEDLIDLASVDDENTRSEVVEIAGVDLPGTAIANGDIRIQST